GLLARARVAAAEYAGDPLPQPHGSPCRRRHAHSLANAAIATTNSHHRSRIGTLASRPAAPPAWGCSTGVAGRHSSEYVSRATTRRSGPVGDSYEYTPGGSDSSARPVASKRSVSVRLVPAAVNVTVTSRGEPAPVQRHATGIPLGAACVTGTNLSHPLAPPARSQSANAATTARYASALAPPRNAQRNRPAAATVARRAPPPVPPAPTRVTSAVETGVRLAASRHPPPSGSDSTKVRTGTRATSLSVRARKRLSQSGGDASSTTEGWGLTSSVNQRASSRGSSSPT